MTSLSKHFNTAYSMQYYDRTLYFTHWYASGLPWEQNTQLWQHSTVSIQHVTG